MNMHPYVFFAVLNAVIAGAFGIFVPFAAIPNGILAVVYTALAIGRRE